MPAMSAYCKAYSVQQLRAFPRWKEKLDDLYHEEDSDQPKRESLADDDYLFVHDSFIVTDGVFSDENIVFDDITEDWKAFCRRELEFEPPAAEPAMATAALAND